MLGSIPAEHIAVYSCNQEIAAHLGELSVASLKARGVVGAVVDGGCRDVRFIIEEGFPVFSRHVTPEDGVWRWDLIATNVPISVGRAAIEPGDWIVADEDGVIAVPAAIVEDVLAEAEEKVATESAIRSAVRRGSRRSLPTKSSAIGLLIHSTNAGVPVRGSRSVREPSRPRVRRWEGDR